MDPDRPDERPSRPPLLRHLPRHPPSHRRPRPTRTPRSHPPDRPTARRRRTRRQRLNNRSAQLIGQMRRRLRRPPQRRLRIPPHLRSHQLLQRKRQSRVSRLRARATRSRSPHPPVRRHPGLRLVRAPRHRVRLGPAPRPAPAEHVVGDPRSVIGHGGRVVAARGCRPVAACPARSPEGSVGHEPAADVHLTQMWSCPDWFRVAGVGSMTRRLAASDDRGHGGPAPLFACGATAVVPVNERLSGTAWGMWPLRLGP